MSKKIIIFGAGGHGKVVLDILLESGAEVEGFIDDDISRKGTKVSGYPVIGTMDELDKIKSEDISFALGIGNNNMRHKKFSEAKKKGKNIVNAIHPKSIVSKTVKIGEGVVIMPGAVINTETVIEDGVVVNTSASVDHDCYLEKFCQIWPGAHLAGTVRVGEFSYIGTGASVIQNLNIGKNAMVGSGAAVIRDIPDGATAVGVPAKIVKEGNK